MEGMYPLTEENKRVAFNLLIYDRLNDIDRLTDVWFDETFINPKDYISNDLLVENLISSLEYNFAMAFWWVEVGESLGYTFDSKDSLTWYYERFKNYPNGYRFLVRDERYDPYDHKVLTEEEIADRREKCDEIAMKILEKLKLEENIS